MNYDELAQRIVALGYGIKTKMTAGHHSWWVYSYNQTAEQFCNDGRTVLAMMEKVHGIDTIRLLENDWGVSAFPISEPHEAARLPGDGEHKSLAVAILTACCDALEGEK